MVWYIILYYMYAAVDTGDILFNNKKGCSPMGSRRVEYQPVYYYTTESPRLLLQNHWDYSKGFHFQSLFLVLTANSFLTGVLQSAPAAMTAAAAPTAN